jgi:hypothetical protein
MLSKYVDFLNREDIKKNLKQIIHPIGELILEESKPFCFMLHYFYLFILY